MRPGDTKQFGLAVRSLRIAQGWTQEQLAYAANLHPTYIGGIERGERNVGLKNILRIARALSVPPGRLFKAYRK